MSIQGERIWRVTPVSACQARRGPGSVIRAPIGRVSPTPGTDTTQPASVLVAVKPDEAAASSRSSGSGTRCA
jgi:hypothetical protein